MFIDKATISIKAGNGGNGCCSFRREAFVPKGGPNGGDGAPGGDVIFVGDPGQLTLLDFLYNTRFAAQDGGNGKGKDMHGRRGKDLRIKVPVGTAPREHEPGEIVDPIEVSLELKIVADIGLVGYPNAGKSTLLSDLTNANPKIAPYPFTTLNPVVGIMEFEDFGKITMADIPGLVDGAHENVGLGHEFLRHIERTKMLVYVLDMAGTDGRNPVDDLHALKRELELYAPGLSDRARLIIANKMDVDESRENLEELMKDPERELPVFPMSAVLDPDFNELKNILREMLAGCPEPPDPTQTIPVE